MIAERGARVAHAHRSLVALGRVADVATTAPDCRLGLPSAVESRVLAISRSRFTPAYKRV
jgi:hypothetical protein